MDLSLDISSLFPEGKVCLYADMNNTKVWRIIDVEPSALNYLRIWLTNNISTVAINWVQVNINTSSLINEHIAHRLSLVPIDADPLRMVDFTGDTSLCSEDTCIIFDLNINNPTRDIKNVLSGDLVWVPLGRQADLWSDRPPKPVYDDLIIAKLAPGQEINMRVYAIRGTNEQHAKWSQTFVHYRLIPSRIIYNNIPEGYISGCEPCERLINIKQDPLFKCYYFTLELLGGLTFGDIQRQLDIGFDWGDRLIYQPPQYIF